MELGDTRDLARVNGSDLKVVIKLHLDSALTANIVQFPVIEMGIGDYLLFATSFHSKTGSK